MKKIILLIATNLCFYIVNNSYAQQVRSDHANPQSGTHYNSGTTAGCSPCTITDPEKAADSSLTNYAVVSAKGSASARAKLKVKLSDTADVGGVAGIAMKRSGSANPAVLSKITINTYYNTTLQESKNGNALTSFVINATTGVRAIEFTTSKKFNYVEVEVHRLGSGINSIDFFYGYGEDPSPLPIKLVSFDAAFENDFVRLKWATASEYNNDYFIVEKSEDGINYKYLDRVDSRGNTVNITEYSTVDFFPSDIAYYRLSQVDKDNHTRVYSKIVKLCKEQDLDALITTYPNPAIDYLNVEVTELTDAKIEIRDLSGSVFSVSPVLKTQNKIDISSLPPGNYMILVINRSGVLSRKKFVKV